jgi:uncharacterized protein (TIGR03435 family)
MRICACAAVLICAWSNGRAQPRPEFEVASVKSSPEAGTPTININLGAFKNGTLTFGNVSLSDLLKYAFNITSDAQLAGPEWITSKAVRFDIEAKTAPDTPREQLALMLQTLLADRVKLAVHHEQREMRYLTLTPRKDGPKMAKAEEPPPPDSGYTMPGRIVRHHMAMAQLATLISRFERQPVVDMTGLTGFYDVKLEWTPTDFSAQSPTEPAVGPSIFSAVQSELGLKLEARQGPLDVLVVDHALQVPTEN